MAKKRSATPAEPPAPAPEPMPPNGAPAKVKGRPKLANPKPPLPIVMTVRARPEYLDWLAGLTEALAKQVGVGQVDRMLVFDRAMTELAKVLGQPAPPRRY